MPRTLTQQRARVLAIAMAALVAGCASTLVQVVLWATCTDAWLALLARDVRLAAALVPGTAVLPPPPTFDTGTLLAAGAVHTMLSLADAAVLAWLTDGRSRIAACVIARLLALDCISSTCTASRCSSHGLLRREAGSRRRRISPSA